MTRGEGPSAIKVGAGEHESTLIQTGHRERKTVVSGKSSEECF